jgi:hypothetical protein
LANPAYLQPFVMPASIALSEAIESDLMGLTPEYAWAASGSNWHWVLNQAEEALFNSKVPMARAKYVVVDADTYSILRQYPSFSERWLNGRNVGKIGELFILRTQFLRPGGPCPAFAQDAGVLVSRRLPRCGLLRFVRDPECLRRDCRLRDPGYQLKVHATAGS